MQAGAVSISSTGHIDSIYPSLSINGAKDIATQKNLQFTELSQDTVLSPGLIDVHCHISELGRDWEGFHTATRAAAAGGITTLMGMPLNSIPATTTVDSLKSEIEAAHMVKMMADVGFWGGAVPSNTTSDGDDEVGLASLEKLLDAGVFGLKAFLAPLPKDAGYETVTPAQLKIASKLCGKKKKPVLVHCELMTLEEQTEYAKKAYDKDNGDDDDDNIVSYGSYEAHVKSRPVEWEQSAVRVVCELANDCHMHIVHLSDAGCLEVIEKTKHDLKIAQQKRLSGIHSQCEGNLTVETCPHYLLFDSQSLPWGDTRYKCFPPIRSKVNQYNLWKSGLLANTCQDILGSTLIDMIASDHSPCASHLRLKQSKNVQRAWGGLTGLQYQLPASVTALSNYIQSNNSMVDYEEGEALAMLAKWWSTAPSKLVPGMSSIKGSIDVGQQADLCAWDSSFFGKPSNYSAEHHRWKGDSAYANMDLKGRVLMTWLRGVPVYNGETDKFVDSANGIGSILLSNSSSVL